MKKFAVWSLVTILLAVILHLAFVWYLPQYITATAVTRAVSRAGGFNKLIIRNIENAGDDTVVLSNPDSKFSSTAYDVSQKPVRIKCVVPDSGNYWSVSFYAWNTDNFYVVNDRTAKAKEFTLVIVKPESKYQKIGNEEVIFAPTDKGVMLIRMMVNDRNDKDEVARLTEFQKQTVIEPIENAVY